MTATRRRGNRFQVNVPLDDEHWYLVLLQLSIREGISVPELLRPVIIRYLKGKVKGDPKLAAAVEYLEQARSDARARRGRRAKLAEVTEMATSVRKGSRRKPQLKSGASLPGEHESSS